MESGIEGRSVTEAPALVDVVDEATPDDAKAVAGIAATIAATLTATSARWPDQPAPHPTDRTGVRVISTPEYDVWLLRWPAGTRVQPHDHGDSVGAFSVVRGRLLELRWHSGVAVSRRVHAGETVTIGRGVVHDVVGDTDGALSVHVYSPPLSSMSFYDDEEATRVVGHESVDGRPAGQPAPGRPLMTAAADAA